MTSLALRLSRLLGVSSSATPSYSLFLGAQRGSKCWLSTTTFDSDNGEEKNEQNEEEFDDFLGKKPELEIQGVDKEKVTMQTLMERASTERLRKRQELEKKLQKQAKTMDDFERAKREKFAPLLKAAFQEPLLASSDRWTSGGARPSGPDSDKWGSSGARHPPPDNDRWSSRPDDCNGPSDGWPGSSGSSRSSWSSSRRS